MTRIVIEHLSGYSKIDHVGEELAQMAREEFAERPQTFQSAYAAIRRAKKRAKALAEEAPHQYGVFRFLLPRLVARRIEA